jgi:hypothetical protein
MRPDLALHRDEMVSCDQKHLHQQYSESLFYSLGILFIRLTVLGIEVRALYLLGKCSTTQITLPALFALVTLEIGSCFKPGLAWTTVLLFVLPA